MVELSIVLVILGLLVGGVLSGQALIHASELRSVSTEIEAHRTALYAFRNKYMALPGDMPNAVRFWGAQAGGITDGPVPACSNLDHNDPAAGTPTCNGTGDGNIAGFERYRAWQHLANAGLIKGTYTGVPSAIGSFDAGWNTPESRFKSNRAHALNSWGHIDSSSTSMYPGSYGLGFQILWADETGSATAQTFTPEDQWNIDVKSDDGKPATGRIRGRINSYHPNCTTNATLTADYNLGYSATACNIMGMTGL